jgi:dsDNA-specific endonuclease/ATPase MutS2
LRAIINETVVKKAPLVEIIPGKDSGALKKHVLRFLGRKVSVPPGREGLE